MSLDRISGALVAVFGLALLVFIVPGQVEEVSYGWVRPETVPNAVAVALVLLGLWKVFTPGAGNDFSPRRALRAFFYLGYAALAVWAMGRFGFAAVAPVMMLALMLLIGERRPLWLAIGTIAVPGLIWGAVAVLLDRTLPG